MGRHIILSSVAIMLLGTAGLAAQDPIVSSDLLIAEADPSLVGWWPLDFEGVQMALDHSGGNRYGILYGDPQWVQGYLNGAIEVDGLDDFVETSFVENLGQWTACVWAKSPAPPSGAPASGPVHREANFQLNWNHQDERFRGAAALRVEDAWQSASFGQLSGDAWHHLAATFDGVSLKAYVNGALITTNSAAHGVPFFEPTALTFGRHSAASQFFAGAIDDVRVYNRALTGEEIQRIVEWSPGRSRDPVPANGGSLTIRRPAALLWSAGETAVGHDVYFGADADAVEVADVGSPLYRGRQIDTAFPLTGLVEVGNRYFWRIDEVEADGVTIHRGVVWSFTVSGYSIIDDFEGYSDKQGSRIDEAWADGSINDTASEVSRWIQPSGTAGRNSRNKQTLILAYDNARSPYYSEAERQFVPEQDWTAGLADTLSLSVKGDVVSFAETAPGVYTMSASGNDIWSNKDNCRFAFKRLDGNGSMSVRVDSIVMTDVWAKAGVMIRESLDPGSANAFMLVTPTGRRDFQNRPDNGSGLCFAAHSSVGTISLPYWIKLERRGDQFTAYHSPDGIRWIRQPDDEEIVSYQSSNPQTISMPNSAYIGLALCSHNGGAATTAVFGDVKTMGYVGSKWQVEEIGFDHPGNMPDDLYVVVEDGDGKVATVTHPDPWAVNAPAWTEWRIPFSDLAGVDLTRVQGLRIGVGGRESSTPPGDGIVCIDDILVWKP
jgi:hypothetical protein